MSDKDCIPVRGLPHAVALYPLWSQAEVTGRLLFQPGRSHEGADGVIHLMDAQAGALRVMEFEVQQAYRQVRDLVGLLAAERGEPSPVTVPRG